MQQKRNKYVPKEDKEFVNMMLEIARRPGVKVAADKGTNVNTAVIDNLVERIKKGENIRKPEKKSKE